jgi:hypothetical protein
LGGIAAGALLGTSALDLPVVAIVLIVFLGLSINLNLLLRHGDEIRSLVEICQRQQEQIDKQSEVEAQ